MKKMHKSLFNKTAVGVGCILTLLMSGCTTTVPPREFTKEQPSTFSKAVDAKQNDPEWQTPAYVEEGNSSIVLTKPTDIPNQIKNQKIDIELDPGRNIVDLVAVLGLQGYPIIIADESIANKTFYIPRFKGKLGDFLAAISKATNVWFTWSNNVITVTGRERVAISMPQDKSYAESIQKELDSLGQASGATAGAGGTAATSNTGGKNISVSWMAGVAYLELTPLEFSKVVSSLKRLSENAAIVTLQVAIINVSLDQSVKQGIDWDQLQMASFKNGNISKYTTVSDNLTTGFKGGSSTTTGTTGTTGTTTTPTTSTTTDGKVAGLLFSGTALKGAIYSDAFNIAGAFNFLQTYGETKVLQNLSMRTFTGSKVEYSGVTEIPYISGVTATTTGSTVSTTSGSTQTSKADDGITFDATPSYDSFNNTVNVNMTLSLKAVLSFKDLSAGNQIGTLNQQPITAERKFSNTVILRPGQTVIVGGITYDSVGNSNSLPVYLRENSALEGKSLTVNRQTMFIMVRPTVTKLGKLEDFPTTTEDSVAKPYLHYDAKVPVEESKQKTVPASKKRNTKEKTNSGTKAKETPKVEPVSTGASAAN